MCGRGVERVRARSKEDEEQKKEYVGEQGEPREATRRTGDRGDEEV